MLERATERAGGLLGTLPKHSPHSFQWVSAVRNLNPRKLYFCGVSEPQSLGVTCSAPRIRRFYRISGMDGVLQSSLARNPTLVLVHQSYDPKCL
jgi:hypothetical protein